MGVLNKKSLYIIAEIGSVHDGSYGNACKLIELAAKCGANAIKFQTHFGEKESLSNAKRPDFFKSEDRIKYFNRTSFSFSQYKNFIYLSKKNNIDFLSSPFSTEAVDFLEKLKIQTYKIPSGEVTNHPLLEKVAKTKKKIFLSTGMSSWREINEAVKILKKNRLTLLQCTSLYPCPVDKVGLNIIKEMINKYKISVGFSDHTKGYVASIGAIFSGAEVIEKHITFSQHMYGSDAFNAMEIEDFNIFVKNLREAYFLRDYKVDKDKIFYLKNIKKIFEKSIVLKHDVHRGTIINKAHLAFKKPGDGISASCYKKILGKKFLKNLKKNHKLHINEYE